MSGILLVIQIFRLEQRSRRVTFSLNRRYLSGYLGKNFVTGVIVAELDLESRSCIRPESSEPISGVSSLGEFNRELANEVEVELTLDSLSD